MTDPDRIARIIQDIYMKKLLVLLSLLLFLESCIVLDILELPAFSNPRGNVVKTEILETSNTITTMAYAMYFFRSGGNLSLALTEASVTDMLVLRLLNLDDEDFYNRESVDRCKDIMYLSSALIRVVLLPMTVEEVDTSLTDNIRIAFILTSFCEIEPGRLIYEDGSNNGI